MRGAADAAKRMPFLRRAMGSPASTASSGARGGTATKVTRSNDMGDPDAVRLVAAFTRHDWHAVEKYLASISAWEDRAFFLRLLAESHIAADDWVRASGPTPLPLLVRGMQRVRAAWAARGTGRSQSVADSSWGTFFALLNQAEDDLSAVCSLAPDDPQPWASRITTAYGLELPKAELLRMLAEVDARAPGYRPAYVSAVNGVALKWGGSHALMFDVARRAHANLPDGSPGRVAIAYAHFLREQHYRLWEKDTKMADAYYLDPAVADEVLEAAQRSVLSTAFAPNRDSAWPRVDFAFSLSRSADGRTNSQTAGAELFRSMGAVIPAQSLWAERFGGEAGAQYERSRDLALTPQ